MNKNLKLLFIFFAYLILAIDLFAIIYFMYSGENIHKEIDSIGGIVFYKVNGNTLLNTFIVDFIGLLAYSIFFYGHFKMAGVFSEKNKLGFFAISSLIILAFLISLLTRRYLNLGSI